MAASSTSDPTVRVARFLDRTVAEGPGERTAIWVQGCSIRCPGCFNPHLFTTRGGTAADPGELVARVVAAGTSGVTLLGGEPFDQAAGLAVVASGVRRAGLTVMTFSGYEYAYLLGLVSAGDRAVAALLEATDLLVAGPFRQDLLDRRRPWAGSTNQEFVHLTDRLRDVTAPDRLEVTVTPSGDVALNGWADPETLDALLDGLPLRRGWYRQYQAVRAGRGDTRRVSGSRELGRALRGWRDRTTPQAAGVPAGGVRRAAGLRREELAQLAGLSVDYVVRLEQGRAMSPSVQVLSALARALRLSTAEREHLFVLAGQTAPGAGRIPADLPPGVRRLLDQLDGVALTVCDAAWHMIEWNSLAAALIGDLSVFRGRERNVAWREFTGMPSRVRCSPEQNALFRATLVTDLRAATARYPADPGLRDLVAGLRSASPDFVRLWDSGVVGVHESNSKTVNHPEVGTFVVDCDVLTAPGSDVKIVAYSAPVGSDAADRLKLLTVIGTQSMATP